MTKKPTQSTATLWARFRFSVIGSLLSAPLARGELKRAIQSLADKIWTHPVTGRDVQYSATTIERWYYKARNEQDDPVRVLQRAVRKDRGKVSLDSKLAEHLRGQYRDHPHWSYKLHYNNLASTVKADPSLAPLCSYSTVKRFMQTRGMVRKPRLQPKGPRREIARLELKAWLLDIILSRATLVNVRNELKIENLVHPGEAYVGGRTR
jgi:putative transposase